MSLESWRSSKHKDGTPCLPALNVSIKMHGSRLVQASLYLIAGLDCHGDFDACLRVHVLPSSMLGPRCMVSSGTSFSFVFDSTCCALAPLWRS